MADLAQVVIMGRLTADAAVSTVGAKATPLAAFTVAYNTGFGEYKRSNFIKVECWGKTATAIGAYLTKGRTVTVVGTLENKKWQGQDGLQHDGWTVNSSNVVLVGGGKSDGVPAPEPAQEPTDFGDDAVF